MPPPKSRPSYEEISSKFHLPLNDACKELGICRTLLKRTCRAYNINRWPFKKKSNFEDVKNIEIQKEINKRITHFKTKEDKKVVVNNNSNNTNNNNNNFIKLPSINEILPEFKF